MFYKTRSSSGDLHLRRAATLSYESLGIGRANFSSATCDESYLSVEVIDISNPFFHCGLEGDQRDPIENDFLTSIEELIE